MLFDALKVVPSPFNAHLLVGVLLQSLFFAWALAIVSKHARRPMLVPLLLVFAGLHFGLVNFNFQDSAFESIWSPYVLLCPFLCFLVAAASVASGDVRDLIPLVLAGCFLVHGHVAQPLFVVPLALVAYAALILRHGRSLTRLFRVAPYAHAAAGAIILLFLLPIALDAFRGDQSNLRIILAHFGKHSGDHKTLLQALAYFVAFFCYFPNPEIICDQLTATSALQYGLKWPFLLTWCFIAMLLLIFRHLGRKRQIASPRPFAHWLAVFFGLASLLTIVWGMLINGEMFAFNSYFNYGLLFVPFILLAIALTSFTPRPLATYLRWPLMVLAVPLWILAARNLTWSSDFPTISRDTKAWFEQIRRATQLDKQGPPVKFLSFQHSDWPWATGIALALQRIGADYAIPPDWSFMFDAQHMVDPKEALTQQKVSWWKVRSPAVAGANWISYTPPSVNPSHSEISFSGPESNAQAFVINGWDVSNGPFSWSLGHHGLLYFAALPTTADVEVECDVFPEEFSNTKTQRMSVSFNGGPPQWFQVADRSIQRLRIPAQAWNSRSVATMAFEFPDAVSPGSVGASADTRILGCGFARIRFHLAQSSE